MSGEDWHVGRSWAGHPIEAACPCIKAPCGLVPRSTATCPEHGPLSTKTMRQGHRADQCPAAERCNSEVAWGGYCPLPKGHDGRCR